MRVDIRLTATTALPAVAVLITLLFTTGALAHEEKASGAASAEAVTVAQASGGDGAGSADTGRAAPEGQAPVAGRMQVRELEELMTMFRSMMGDWKGPRLIMPMMNPVRGRKLFAAKGCVTCHSINGVGGEDAPALDAHEMRLFMNPFEFAAKMWKGAGTMIALQEDALGEQINFTGEELADIIAFAHDEEEQHKFSEADIPPEILPMMHHVHGEPGGGAAAHGEELGHKPPEPKEHGHEGGAEAEHAH
jgi:hypothetical protein